MRFAIMIPRGLAEKLKREIIISLIHADAL
jgi:hypothetical protein